MNIIYFYRFGNFAYRFHIPFIPLLMKLFIRIIFNSAIDCSTKIGEKSIFSYGGIAVVIHKDTIIGESVTIAQCVTIGGRSKKKGVPIIENNVYLGAGSKILGNITIGEGSVIGANAVVINSVPPNCIAVGVPAKIIKYDISKDDYV